MKRVVRIFSIIASITTLAACGGGSGGDAPSAVETKTETTHEPNRPTVVVQDGYRIARGATRVQNVVVKFDSKTKSMNLRGKVEYIPMRGQSLRTLDLDLTGKVDDSGFVSLKDSRGNTSDVQVAAKATCLSENNACHSSFVDIYIYADDVVYHHQVESHQEATPQSSGSGVNDGKDNKDNKDQKEGKGSKNSNDSKDSKDPKNVKEPKDPKDHTDPKGSNEPKDPKDPKNSNVSNEDEDEESDDPESENGADDVDGEPGQYVGSLKEDIETLLTVPPPPPPSVDKGDSKKGPAKKITQAIGSVNVGRLEGGVNLFKYQQTHAPAGFHILYPDRVTHFAANEMAYILAILGKIALQDNGGYVLSVGDISSINGGKLGSHKSHQNGLDVDVAYYFKDKSMQGRFTKAVTKGKPNESWMSVEQWRLFKSAVQTQLIDRIFVHKALKNALCEKAIASGELQKGKNEGLAYETLRRLIPDKEHNNHFHLRVKCSSAQVRCRQMAEPAPSSGCF